MAGISPKLPLTVTKVDGTYGLTKTVKEAITQDFKMLILTNPGEKMMNPEFGVGLKRFLFQQQGDSVYSALSSRLISQTKKYLPQVEIEKVLFNESPLDDIDASDLVDNNIMSVTIRFSIKPLKKIEILTIPLL
tara:strand:- start:2 stop:403 length:402 start_codon:yes stop_codon:yes gene_type:complete